jgi:hypothetical protein
MILALHVRAQPYFDVAGLSMWQLPANASLNRAAETEGNMFVSFPLQLDARNTFVVTGQYEIKYLDDPELPDGIRLHNTVLPLALKHQFRDSAWSVTGMALVRAVSTEFTFDHDVFQLAGAVIASYRVRPNLVLKGGLYYSREFFGDFVMPLAGLEWQVNDRLNIFGLINNSIKLEYRFTDRLLGGLVTKNITNSFRDVASGGYYKVSDNHAGVFADVRFGKRLVWSVEAGHTLLRYIKARNGAGFPEQDADGPVFKTGLYYRVRLD